MYDSEDLDCVDARIEPVAQAEPVKDRRRPGRVHDISPTLVPLLRSSADVAIAGTTQTMELHSDNSDQQPATQSPPRDALDLLEEFGTILSVTRGQKIHGQAEQANSCYRILCGCVRMVKLMDDGRRQIGEFLMAGDLIGFEALETHDFAAEAVSDVVLRRYPRRMVDALAERNVALARRLCDLTAVSLRMAHRRLLLLGRKTASERIATFLLEMAGRLPRRTARGMDMPMSRTDIADHLGLTIETVCRIFAHLRRDAIIAIERGSIEIRDRAGLQQMADSVSFGV